VFDKGWYCLLLASSVVASELCGVRGGQLCKIQLDSEFSVSLAQCCCSHPVFFNSKGCVCCLLDLFTLCRKILRYKHAYSMYNPPQKLR
jgi:hypothetical protein